MRTSDVLNRAADLIEERGWWQKGCPSMAVTGHCAATAIWKIAPVHMKRAAENAFLRHLGVGSLVSLRPIFAWNDAPERTATEVVEALRAAAVIEAAKEVDVRVVSSC